MGNLPGDESLKKADSFHRSYQLLRTTKTRAGLHSHPLCNFHCLELVHASAAVVSSYVHHIWCTWKTLFPSSFQQPLFLQSFYYLLYSDNWVLMGRYSIDILFRAEFFKVAYFKRPISCGSLYNVPYFKKKFLWWGLKGCKDKYL